MMYDRPERADVRELDTIDPTETGAAELDDRPGSTTA